MKPGNLRTARKVLIPAVNATVGREMSYHDGTRLVSNGALFWSGGGGGQDGLCAIPILLEEDPL